MVSLLLEEAQAVVVLVALHPGAGVVTEIGVVKIRTVGPCQSLPAEYHGDQPAGRKSPNLPVDSLYNVIVGLRFVRLVVLSVLQ